MTLTLNPVHAGGQQGRLVSGSLLIGRDPKAQLRIADPTASGRHCVISGQGGDWQIQDFSTNGTFLNGRKLESRERLAAGDRVRIAESEWVVAIGEDAGALPATSLPTTSTSAPLERTQAQASVRTPASAGDDRLLGAALEIIADLARTRQKARTDLLPSKPAGSTPKSPLSDAPAGQALAVLKAMPANEAEATLAQAAEGMRVHDLALIEAMQAALHAVLDEFSPDEIQRGGKTDAQAWQAYRAAFEDRDHGFVELFALTFEAKYRELSQNP